MSSEFIKFTTKCSIIHQYTVQNWPLQNGMAKHSNRFLTEHISTMLNESSMVKNFWGECLAAHTHVEPMLWRSHLKHDTLSSMSQSNSQCIHLWVWGCTVYMHIQKNKCMPPGPHMEKCWIPQQIQSLKVLYPIHTIHPYIRKS